MEPLEPSEKPIDDTTLTEQERMSKASNEVAEILNKYNVTISVQNVPVIVPAAPKAPSTGLQT